MNQNSNPSTTIPPMAKSEHRRNLAERCIHFNGIQHSHCRAGVCYNELDRDCRVPYRAGLPCLPLQPDRLAALGDTPRATCQHHLLPTPEQVAEHDRVITAAIERHALVLKAVASIRENQKGKHWTGVIDCPVCHCRLSLEHHTNGHLWGKCETEGCVSFIE